MPSRILRFTLPPAPPPRQTVSPVFSHSPTVTDRARHAAIYDRFRAQLKGFELQVHRGYVTVTWQGKPAFDLESVE